MRLIFCSAILVLASMSSASAQFFEPQRVKDVRIGAIERAIQCEIGRFAYLVRNQRLNPPRLKAGYAVSEKLANTSGGGIDIGFAVLKFGPHISQGATDESEITFEPYNINTKNAAACSRNPTTLQLKGLRTCLEEAAEVYDHSNVKCTTQINVKKDLSVGVTIPWVVTFGPSASFGTDYTRAIKVSAPPPSR